MLRGEPNEYNLISFHFTFRAENVSRKVFSADDTRRSKHVKAPAFHRVCARALILLPF